MEAAFAIEVPAAGVRDRLVSFAEAVTWSLPLRRQRENALLYVRGLVEHPRDPTPLATEARPRPDSPQASAQYGHQGYTQVATVTMR